MEMQGDGDQPQVVNRDPEDPNEARRLLVERWTKTVEQDKAHHKKAFKRMREDMDFCIGKQTLDPVSNRYVDDPDAYVANIVQRHISQRVAALYAKNPKAVARRKQRLLATVWDGSAASAQQAMLAVQESSLTGLQPPPGAIETLADWQQVQQQETMLDRLAKTLELVNAHYVSEQVQPFKIMMKKAVRRALTTAVGYVKLDYQRVMERSPDVDQQISDLMTRISTAERLAADVADGEVDPISAEVEQLKLTVAELEKEAEVLIREGLVFQYPRSTSVIPDCRCRDLRTWAGAGHLTEEFMLTADEIQEVYGVDVSSKAKGYERSSGQHAADEPFWMPSSESRGDDENDSRFCVWEIYNKADGLMYTVCDGYPDFLTEPRAPDVRLERFFPIFALTFNEVEHEDELFPPSDVRLMMPMQREYNRTRTGLREHRKANRPKTIVPAGMLGEEDRDNLKDHPANCIIELKAVQPGQSVDEVLQPWRGPPIDPNLYEVNPVFEDVLRTVGTQEANLGGTSSATATETSIAEGSRLSSLQSNVDDLDDFLTEMARCQGQVLLENVTEETVKRIVGPGAVWPEMSRQDVVEEIYLEVQAGSTGRPNKAQEVQNFERLAPLIMQIPGIDPEAFAREALKRLDDRMELDDMLSAGMPSITAMNQQAKPGTGDPATDPGQQGNEGGNNAPRAAQPEMQPSQPGRPPMQPQVPSANAEV